MTPPRRPTWALLLLSLALLACATLAPTGAAPPLEPTQTPPPGSQGAAPTSTPRAEPSAAPSAEPSAAPPSTQPPSAEPSAAPPSVTVTRFPTLTPTAAPLRLEIVQTQVWADRYGDARANVLFRNPHDFPVAPRGLPQAALRNSAGDLLRQGGLYFLDGISGGVGFLLPGETVAATVCFTCEEALLDEPWAALEAVVLVQDATEQWQIIREVAPGAVNVAFDGDSPLFDIRGTVTNNSAAAVQRIAVRVIVYDAAGLLIGAGETSAWDVPAGSTVSISGLGIGQTPSGPVTTEVTALGVNY
jgi:hypothetical protein